MERRPTESSAIPDRKRCRVSESSPQNSENPYKKTGHISPVFDFKKYYYYWQNGQMKKPVNSRKKRMKRSPILIILFKIEDRF